MAKIGDVCPLFFNPPGKDAFGVDGCYMQMFHSTDVILLQVLAAPGEVVEGTLNNDASGTSSDITFSTYNQNDGVVLHYASLSGLLFGGLGGAHGAFQIFQPGQQFI